jgi:hypothetical protein
VIEKGKSPFYPGQPVPVELFVGRASQIERILTRGAMQTSLGKPGAIFVQGEYGIGKSSIASITQFLAEQRYGLLGIHASLGGAKSLSDVARSVLEATTQSGVYDPSRSELIRNWLSKYVGRQNLFGIASVNLEAMKQDAPNISSPFGMLGFLRETLERVKPARIKGIFLVLDEISGITSVPEFSHFIKGLIDANATGQDSVPLLLMLCGVEARRREMILKHQPVDRIFDIIEIQPMSLDEMEKFYTDAFRSVETTIDPKAMATFTKYSVGFPKIMHLIGDAAYWIDKDNHIDEGDALQAVVLAADDVGKKYIDRQVISAIKSSDYRSILRKIVDRGPSNREFNKSEISATLTTEEKSKFHNFLRKMVQVQLLSHGDNQGEYVFNQPLALIYMWIQFTQSDSRETKQESIG